MASKKLKIFIHSMDGTGHINACVGLAEALVKRGHSVLFLLNSAHKGNFAKFGFDEYLLERAKSTSQNEPPSTEQVNPVKVFAQIMIKSGMFSDKSPMERMRAGTENGCLSRTSRSPPIDGDGENGGWENVCLQCSDLGGRS